MNWLFGRKKGLERERFGENLAAVPLHATVVRENTAAESVMEVANEANLRPCWVRGRKALFHRWANSAHPVLPRGVEVCENAKFFQFRSTSGIVEFENGEVARVWPNEIRFVDKANGMFDGYDWTVNEEETA